MYTIKGDMDIYYYLRCLQLLLSAMLINSPPL